MTHSGVYAIAIHIAEPRRWFDGNVCAGRSSMTTCLLRYIIDPYKIADFEAYGKEWIRLVNRSGGTHHGYFLPSEGADNVAFALFTFPSLATYEIYRQRFSTDGEFIKANRMREDSRCVLSYERTFLRPIFG